MSQDDVDVVRGLIEAYRLGDVATALSCLDVDVILDTTRVAGSIGSVSHGHDALIREVRRFIGAFEDYSFELERITDFGGGTVAAVVNECGRGKGSGIQVERTVATIYSVLAGKIVRITSFPTEPEALEAFGLQE
jgi:ketosteroid isomerase-like protein